MPDCQLLCRIKTFLSHNCYFASLLRLRGNPHRTLDSHTPWQSFVYCFSHYFMDKIPLTPNTLPPPGPHYPRLHHQHLVPIPDLSHIDLQNPLDHYCPRPPPPINSPPLDTSTPRPPPPQMPSTPRPHHPLDPHPIDPFTPWQFWSLLHKQNHLVS